MASAEFQIDRRKLPEAKKIWQQCIVHVVDASPAIDGYIQYYLYLYSLEPSCGFCRTKVKNKYSVQYTITVQYEIEVEKYNAASSQLD